MLVHLDGQLLPHTEAKVSVFDRGFVFGDGIYEGLRAFDGHVVAMDRHIARMRAGLREARIDWDAAALAPLTAQLLAANKMDDCFIYWQVTRGTPGPSDPVRARKPGSMRPTVFGYCSPTPPLATYEPPNLPPTKSAVILEDTRWLRGHIKSIALMGGVLNVIEANERGHDDAVLVRDGLLAETTSANVVVVLPRADGTAEIATPSLGSTSFLAGVTRDILLEEAARQELAISDRSVTTGELQRASEVIAVGTLTMITSITRLDGRELCGGKAGPVAVKLLKVLVDAISREWSNSNSARL
ncbi:MAG TPA: aminotransferase class IV [Phycisphaerales bacterium]|nr:aminotransferase class IV [Phycisphaerales bacterium]